ncbi:unnamed protein product [Linum trigynum]|uniref:DC1 domain-containing protein n=1 Tax=Linum trigynum TaxID=586398 RepID=A0AAV2GI11_9ROSI
MNKTKRTSSLNTTATIFSTKRNVAPSPPPPSTAAAGGGPFFEFPTSPQKLAWGEGIIHSGHPQHLLYNVDLPDLFTCSGCKEYGSGKSFACRQCDFRLHEFCALAPPRLKAHPLHLQHQLWFSSKPAPKTGILQKANKCDVCGKATKGYTFRCSACSYHMHPCCATLSDHITISIHPHPLKILPAAASSSAAVTLSTPGNNGTATSPAAAAAAVVLDISGACGECKRRRAGRVYKCTVCDGYYLHAVCAKDMVNGLQANGMKGKEKAGSKMLGTAARVASQVVIEFIGGLIDGLGEGVGQALVQSVTDTKALTPLSNTKKVVAPAPAAASSGGCCGGGRR